MLSEGPKQCQDENAQLFDPMAHGDMRTEGCVKCQCPCVRIRIDTVYGSSLLHCHAGDILRGMGNEKGREEGGGVVLNMQDQ